MQTPIVPNVGDLLSHTAWLRNLARMLAGSSDVADEIVQDAWSVALQNPPDPERPSRPWLAGVARNLLFKRKRDLQRRRVRDAKDCVDPSLANERLAPSPEALVQQAQAFRILADLVCELDEARRTVVLLRFFQDQTSEQIGRTLCIPPGTVRRQLKEALGLLRERMDKRHGGRRAWAGIVLLPQGALLTKGELLRPRPPVSTKAISALALVAAVVVLVVRTSEKSPSKQTNQRGPRALDVGRLAFLSEPEIPTTGQLSAFVVDGQNAPVANASVLLRCPENCPRSWGGDRVEFTDATGVVEFDDLPNAAFTLRASAIGYMGTSAKSDVRNGRVDDPVRLVLNPGGFAVVGTVVDDGGGPIAAAVVTAGSTENPGLGISGTDGRFELRLPRGTHDVSVNADGYALLQGESVEVAGDVVRNFSLSPAASVTGQVLDSDNKAVAGALVMASTSARPHRPAYATADDNGYFRFSRLGGGALEISARKGSAWGAAPSLPELVATKRLTGVRIILESRPSVAGVVVDSHGTSVSACTVRIEPGPVQAGFVDGDIAARCDAGGAFSIEALPPGRFKIQVRADGYAWSSRDFLLLDSPLALKFTLEHEALINGIVLGPDGRSVPGAQVDLTTRAHNATDARATGAASATTDGKGRFEGHHLGSGYLTASARDKSLGHAETTAEVVDGQSQDIVIRFAKGAFLSGKVQWDDGSPAHKVIARWHGGSEAFQSATDEAGRFRIGPVPEGFGELAAKREPNGMDSIGGPPGPERKIIFLKSGLNDGTEFVLILKRNDQSISGKVIDGKHRGLANVRVFAGQHGHASDVALGLLPSGFVTSETSTDSDGRFTISGLVKGEHEIVALSARHPMTTLAAAKAPGRDVVLQLGDPCEIRGSVTDTEGVPVKTFEVLVRPTPLRQPVTDRLFASLETMQKFHFAGIPKPPKWTTSASGSFVLSHLAEATSYDVMIRTPDERYGGSTKVHTTPRLATFVPITVRSGQTVHGQVVDMDTGTAMASLGIALANRSALFETHTDDKGFFHLRGVFPAVRELIRLRAFPKHLSETVAVDVPADGTDVNLGPIAVFKIPPEPATFPSGEVPRLGSVSTGIVLQPFSHPPKIVFVVPASPAARAGVQAGATILEIDGHPTAYAAADTARFLLDTPVTSRVSVKLQSPTSAVQAVTLQKVSASGLGIPMPM